MIQVWQCKRDPKRIWIVAPSPHDAYLIGWRRGIDHIEWPSTVTVWSERPTHEDSTLLFSTDEPDVLRGRSDIRAVVEFVTGLLTA